MRILVTGGAGYIGSHTCKELARNGYEPIVFDNLSSGHKESVKWGPLEIGDLRDISRVESLFAKYNFEGVIHFAAKAYVYESVINPINYFENNISGSSNLLSIMRKNRIRNIIFSSSCATYGEIQEPPIRESQKQEPINPYGFTKFAIERLLEYMSANNDLNYGILRYFNAAGSDPDGEIGESHNPETHIIPNALDKALKGQIFEIFGHDYATNDGTAIRDYVHVTDLARAHVLALKHIKDNNANLILNLGSGQGTSNLEIVHEIKKSFGDFKFEFTSRRAGDPASLVADISKARQLLQWEPINSSLENIIATTINWKMNKTNY